MIQQKITASALADLLGISDRRVRDLRAEGVLPGAAGAPYDLRESVRAYCGHIRPSSGREASGGASTATLNTSRIALLAEQTRKLRVENDLEAGRILPVDDVTKEIARCCAVVRGRLLAIPSEQAADLARLRSAAEVAHRLELVITDALRELSEGGLLNAADTAEDDPPPAQEAAAP